MVIWWFKMVKTFCFKKSQHFGTFRTQFWFPVQLKFWKWDNHQLVYSGGFGISTSSSELFVLNRFRMVCNKPQTTAIDSRTSGDTYERCLWYTLIRDPDRFEEDLVSFWQNADFDCHTHFWALLHAKVLISSVCKPFQSLFLVVAAIMSLITVIWGVHHGQLAGA